MQSTSVIGFPIRTGGPAAPPLIGTPGIGNITEVEGAQPLPLGSRQGGIPMQTVQNSFFTPFLEAGSGRTVGGSVTGTRDILISELQYGMFDTAFRNELQRSSFFEMLSPSPSVNQLFSPDYRELVARLVEIQEKQFLTENLDYLGISAQLSSVNQVSGMLASGTLDNTLGGIDIVGSSLAVHSGLTHDMGGNLLSGSQELNSNTPYNHVLHDNGAAKRDANTAKQPVHSKAPPQEDQKAQPYFEKRAKNKNKKAATDEGNRSAGIIKALVRGLNALSNSLSKYLD